MALGSAAGARGEGAAAVGLGAVWPFKTNGFAAYGCGTGGATAFATGVSFAAGAGAATGARSGTGKLTRMRAV